MKRLIWFICAAVMLAALMLGASMSASATVVEGACGDTYNYDTGKYDNITWTFDTETGVLTISGEGKMGTWSWGGSPWHSYRAQIKSVVIGEGVTNIADNAFTGFSAMTDISIPSSMAEIESVFEDCNALESVYITDLEAWCQIAFYSQLGNPLCRAETMYLNGEPVTELTIPNTITVLNDNVFYDFDTLTKVVLPDGLLSIGKSAFSRCPLLTEINIPDSVKTIKDSAFFGCEGIIDVVDDVSYVDGWMIACATINTVELCEGTVGIAERALPSNLKTLYIPSSLRVVGADNDIRQFDVAIHIADIGAWCGIDFYKGLASNTKLYVNGELLTDLVIPDGVTSIGNIAFAGYSELVSVKLPESVISVGERSFAACGKLTSVELPSSLTSIGKSAFNGCGALTNLDIPEGLQSIDEEAFYQCSSLESVSFPSTLSFIGKGAFNFCNKMESVYISDIEAWCETVLEDRYANPAFNGAQFYLNGELITELDIPNSVTSIGNYAFYSVQTLTDVTLPDSITAIGDSAFSYCYALESIRMPNNLVSIGEYAFYECKKLKSISLSDTVTSIGQCAFYKCEKLESVELPNSIVSIEKNVFQYCIALKEIDIPMSVTSIGNYAFDNCTSLTTLRLHPGVVSIGQNGISNCKNLKSIIFCGTKQQWIAIKKGDYCFSFSSGFEIFYHDWDEGAVDEAHSSSALGKKTYTCDVCGETRSETIGHSYGNWTQHNETSHQKTCACGDVQTATHTYDNAKDTTCNVCGYAREIVVQTTAPMVTTVVPETTRTPNTNEASMQAQTTVNVVSNDTSKEASGCGASLSAYSGCLILLSLGAAAALFKKKEESRN